MWDKIPGDPGSENRCTAGRERLKLTLLPRKDGPGAFAGKMDAIGKARGKRNKGRLRKANITNFLSYAGSTFSSIRRKAIKA